MKDDIFQIEEYLGTKEAEIINDENELKDTRASTL